MSGTWRNRLLIAALLLAAIFVPKEQWCFRNQIDIISGQWTVSDGYPPIDPRAFERVDGREYGGRLAAFNLLQRFNDNRLIVSWAQGEGRGSKEAWALATRHCSEELMFKRYREPMHQVLNYEALQATYDARAMSCLEAATLGRQVDPENAFFIVSQAGAHWALGHRGIAQALLQEAAAKPTFRQYTAFETQILFDAAAAAFGYRGALIKASIELKRRFFGARFIQQFANELAVRGAGADRAALIVVAGLMAKDAEETFDVTSARFATQSLLIGKSLPKVAAYPQERERLASVSLEQLVAESERPEIAGIYQSLIRKEPNAGIFLDAHGPEITRMGQSQLLGAGLLASLMALLIAGLANREVLSVQDKPWTGSLPHLLSAAAWFAVAQSLSQGGMFELKVLSIAHVALALQYGPRWLGWSAALAWIGFLLSWNPDKGMLQVAELSSVLFQPIGLLATAVLLFVCYHPDRQRRHWASVAGCAFALASIVMSVSSPLAMLPGVAFGLGWATLRFRISDRPTVGALVMLASCVAIGLGYVVLASSQLTLTLSLAFTFGAAVLAGLLFQPLRVPGRTGMIGLVLAVLYVLSVGATLRANEQGEAMLNAYLNQDPGFTLQK